jgi:nucleotide-binding universal stress UspA family protein
MKTIVLGTDGSPGAKRATGEAVELAAETCWPLRIVSVWSVPSMELSAAPMMAGELAEVARDRAQEALDAAADEAADAGIAAITYLRQGDIPARIMELAELIGDAVIVVGSDGRGAIGRALLGSVSTRLVHAASCPVLVVRPAAGAEAESDEHVALAGRV